MTNSLVARMIDTIKEKLKGVEGRENVRILQAVESGSRAWGFASPDSDFDVRFIYVRQTNDYLKLSRVRDVIESELDETLDVNRWDLKKALQLLYKSNPTLFEWNNSPIVYKTTDDWALVRKEINNYFLAKAGLHHYLSTAAGNYREYLKGDTVKLKKYFYVIRPLLACRWILDKKCPPPMLFSELVDAELEVEMRPVIEKLLAQKAITSELGEGNRIEELNDFIELNLTKLKTIVDAMPADRKTGWEKLNELFLSIVSFTDIKGR